MTTAVVRGSAGEPVILLRGDAHQQVPETTLNDIIKAAAAVLSPAELQTATRAIPRLRTSQAVSCVSVDGTVLTVYRLTVS
jgi:hypothetical protein